MESHGTASSSPQGTPEPLHRRILEAAAIGLLALVLNLAGNGRVSLWDRDEPRYASCTREMRASGDWIHPTFNGRPRYDKPVLIYWLMLAGTAIGGDNPFGTRLISSLAGAGTCLLVWHLGRRLFGPRQGRLAALVLATAPIMVAESKLSTTDATLMFWLVGGQLCLWELSLRPSRWAAFGFWVLLALATLTKGPIGPALLAVSGLVSWLCGGPTACWARLRWRAGLAIFLVLALPWYVAVGLYSHGEFFRVAMGYHVLRRMTHGIEQHGAFPGYYLVSTLLLLYPWSTLLPASVLAGWRARRESRVFGFLLGWIVGPLILLECVQTKLVHYYLPAYPACALLVAWLLDAVAGDVVNLRRWPLGRLGFGLLAGIGVALTAALTAAVWAVPGPTRWPCLVEAILVGAGTLVALEQFQRGATRRAAGCLMTTWALVELVAGAWLAPAAEPYRFSQRVGERLAQVSVQERAEPILGTFQEPSIVYAFGRPIPLIHGPNDLVDLLRKHGRAIAPLVAEDFERLQLDARYVVEVPETMRGFNLSKGRTETVQMTVIRLRSGGMAVRAEQPLVK